MSVIRAFDYPNFEEWIIAHHRDLFDEWETEASEYLDLDEWLDIHYFEVIEEWESEQREKP